MCKGIHQTKAEDKHSHTLLTALKFQLLRPAVIYTVAA